MKLDRREFFKSAAGVTALTLGLNAFSPTIFKRKLLAAPPVPGRKKLVFIFFRGGNDALNTAIPDDPMYSPAVRGSLYISPNDSIALDGTDPLYPIDSAYQSSFIRLHPQLAPLMAAYQAGDVAVLHRVGYKNQSQSHFDSQQFYENGTNNPYLEEGMLYRQAAETLDLVNNRLGALSISGSQVVALKGTMPIPSIPDLKTFKFAGSDARTLKFLGRLPGPGQSGRGILGTYGGVRDSSEKPYRDLVYQTGLVLADAMNTIRANGINPDTYVPANGATYPTSSSFYYKAKQIAQLLKETPVQIIGMNIGGFDTHTNQEPAHGNLLNQVAQVIRAFHLDLRDQWNDLVIVTMSEFGRTTYTNGSDGTDHGSSGVMLVAGGGVKGGVYNARDVASWTADGGVLSTSNGRYLKYWTDYRAVFAELFLKHFGDDNGGTTPGLPTLNRVIPGYNGLAVANPKEYTQLGFMA